MAVNLPGPYEIEFAMAGWTSPVRTHVFRMSVAIVGTPAAGALPSAITVQKTGGGTATLQAVADQAWNFLRLNWNNTITCTGFTLWKYVAGTYAKNFISAGAVANPAGTGTGLNAMHQTTLTFRSANGGVLKFVLLEGVNSGDNHSGLVPNAAGTAVQKWAAYVLSADNVALARDDSYPVAAMFDSRGQNERIWRKINRGT